MKATEFCYWLQGVFELAKPTSLNEEQTRLVKAHLALVFIHEIDPSYGPAAQPKLNEAHAQPFKIGGQAPDGTIYRC